MLKKTFTLLALLSLTASAQFWDVQEAPSAIYGGVGLGTIQNLAAEDPAYQAFLGKYWSLGEYFALNTAVEGVTDFEDSHFLDAILGLNYYPFSAGFNSISPYIGAGGGFGAATVTNGDEWNYGFNLSGTAGLLLFRGNAVEIMLEGNLDWLFNEVVGEDNPMVWTGRIGLLF